MGTATTVLNVIRWASGALTASTSSNTANAPSKSHVISSRRASWTVVTKLGAYFGSGAKISCQLRILKQSSQFSP